MAVHKNLNPVSIGDDTEEEILFLQAKISNIKVRFIYEYGPQEDELEKSKPFLQNWMKK